MKPLKLIVSGILIFISLICALFMVLTLDSNWGFAGIIIALTAYVFKVWVGGKNKNGK